VCNILNLMERVPSGIDRTGSTMLLEVRTSSDQNAVQCTLIWILYRVILVDDVGVSG